MNYFGEIKPLQEVDDSEKTKDITERTSETEGEIQGQYDGYLKSDKAREFEYKSAKEKESDTADYKQDKSLFYEYLNSQDKETLIKAKERILAGDKSIFYEMGYKDDSSDEGVPQKVLKMHNRPRQR